jgi:RimJ/RimL family protein N-acetyltransferase
MVEELRTERLVLRPFRADDGDAFAACANDPAYRRYLGPNHPDAAQLVANNLSVDGKRELSWAVTLDGDVVGSIFLGVQAEDGIAELACLLAPTAWGQGIALEAGRAVVGHAFSELGLHKVFARADAGNSASRRAMEKAGMRQEGLLREHRANTSGARVDEVIYGVTRDEWRSQV